MLSDPCAASRLLAEVGRARVALLDAVVLPTMRWGLESLNVTKAEARRFDAIQRTMVAWVLRIPQRAAESAESFFRRRERCTTAAITKFARAKWCEIQEYTHDTLAGHPARLSHETMRPQLSFIGDRTDGGIFVGRRSLRRQAARQAGAQGTSQSQGRWSSPCGRPSRKPATKPPASCRRPPRIRGIGRKIGASPEPVSLCETLKICWGAEVTQ